MPVSCMHVTIPGVRWGRLQLSQLWWWINGSNGRQTYSLRSPKLVQSQTRSPPGKNEKEKERRTRIRVSVQFPFCKARPLKLIMHEQYVKRPMTSTLCLTLNLFMSLQKNLIFGQKDSSVTHQIPFNDHWIRRSGKYKVQVKRQESPVTCQYVIKKVQC